MVVTCGMGGTPAMPGGQTAVADPVEMVTTITRIGGTLTGTATFEPLDGPDPLPGNIAVVAPGYRALSWRFLRSTEQDPGNGSICELRVGNVLHHCGSGPQYQENGFDLASDEGEVHMTEIEFEASGEAYVEILVVRDR